MVGWITENLEPITEPLDALIEGVGGRAGLCPARPLRAGHDRRLPPIAFFLAGWRVALFTALGLVLIISLGLWD